MSEFDYEGIEIDEDDDTLQMTSVYERAGNAKDSYLTSINAADGDDIEE